MIVSFLKPSLRLLLVSVLVLHLSSVLAFVQPPLSTLPYTPRRSSTGGGGSSIGSSPTTTDDDFASFAASFDDDDDDILKKKKTTTKSSTKSPSSSTLTSSTRSWKEDLEDLLDPTTPMAKRQVLLADLLSANQDIRQAVQTALREQKIDPLLTPRGKRIQDGTRAVARQLTVDILPNTFATTASATDAPSSTRTTTSSSSSSRERSKEKPKSSVGSRKKENTSSSSSSSSRFPMGVPVPPLPSLGALPKLDFLVPPPTEVTKMGRRILDALQREVQNNLATLQDDLADPTTRIPKRVQQQTQSFLEQATNVFAETPVNLSEPPYTIYQSTSDYEIRDYQSYIVASTNMVPVGQDDLYDNVLQDNPGRSVSAFNTLAAYYLLGANKEQRPISNTGCFPLVTTTMLGEMRFYIDDKKFGAPPEPLEQDDEASTSRSSSTSKSTRSGSSSTSKMDFVYETGAIFLEEIPPARLAVRRFTGFCTAGEVARQKQALLAALDLDGVELDVPHGGTVPHVVFQYNPPYALPVVRRNEIAVAVLDQSKAVEEASLRKITQLKREVESNTGNMDDETATTPVNKTSSTKAEMSTSKVTTKINGSNDPVVFPDDPWGESA